MPPPVRACFLLLLLGRAAWAGPPPPDDDADEQEMRQIKAALREDQRQRLPPPGPQPAAASPALARLYDLLPEVDLVGELGLSYADLPAPPGPGEVPAGIGFSAGVELGVSKAVDPYFRIEAYATLTPHAVSLLEAYATTLGLPFRLQLRGGYFLHRFGLLNPWHPHALVLIERPLALRRLFGDDGGRGLGLEASWLAPLPWYVEIAAAVQDPIGQAMLPGDATGPLDLLYVLTLKQFFRLPRGLGLSLGLSADLGPNPTGRSNRTDIYGADLGLRYRSPGGSVSITLSSEWMWRRRQVPGNLLQDVSGYAELDLGLRWLVLALRYEYSSQDRHRLDAGLLLQVGRQARVRLQGILDLPEDGGGVLGYAGLLGLQILLGAHAALIASPEEP